MADEMDESLGKKEKGPAPDDVGLPETSAARVREDRPVSAPGGVESAGHSRGSSTPEETVSPAMPQADTASATPHGNEPVEPEGAAVPGSRSEPPSKADAGPVNPNPAAFGGLDKPGLDLLYDVELDATLQFGSKEMLLRDVLELGPGDVVELDRHIAEPVDLVVGDRIVARGEVVVASGNFALRVTEVATPQMRLESIRCLF